MQSINENTERQASGLSRRMRWISLALVVVAIGAVSFLFGAAEKKTEQESSALVQPTASSPGVPVLEEAPPKPEDLKVPEGMVYVPGGSTLIGNDTKASGTTHRHRSSARPPFVADVDPFFLDKHPVTVARFRQFVEQTGYETQAEGFGNAGILDPETRQWRLVEGATWRRPRGPGHPQAKENHPVTQVSWNDAARYCRAEGKRLPTEVEWEHAARGARNARHIYAWGDTLVLDGKYKANTWQGRFPYNNELKDGYQYTSPVGAFGETELGLTDMGGNVWEWTSSWYRPYSERGEPFTPTKRSEKVQRGGSFQCNECLGFRVYTRSHSTPETSLFHVGFRCGQGLPASDQT